jgi:hypothetical protein
MKTIKKIRINNFKGMIEMTEEGETLIKKIQRILDENEPLTDGAPMIYTPVKPEVAASANFAPSPIIINFYILRAYFEEASTYIYLI